MRPTLTSLTIRGFKTIRELDDFPLARLTVLIGPNGAGKSNLLSFFRMLSRMMTPPGELQIYIAQYGGASSLLHDGPARTTEIKAALHLQYAARLHEYSLRLLYVGGDLLLLADENFTMHSGTSVTLGGSRESRLLAQADADIPGARPISSTLRRAIVHHLSDTSDTSRMRRKWSVDDGMRLKEDSGNLAPFLYRLQQTQPLYYQRIVETIRLILPFFADFELQLEYGYLLLRWREVGSDQVFGAWQAADGMLRAMALVALLRQPEEDLPDLLILDEPELGLHPYAIELLAAMLRSASRHVQVIVATQSVSLVDRFEPHDIVVVDRVGRESSYRRLKDADLAEWLENYTLSELWEKNVLDDRPARR
jgi:predicted ATPase